jgi:hypothetical protein
VKKQREKLLTKINNPGNTKENVDESLRFIMTLCDNINYYCKEKHV